MASPIPKPIIDTTLPSVPFSYAQAAKGMSSAGSSTMFSSKAPSTSHTPSKELNSAPMASMDTPSGVDWAEDAEKDTKDAEVHNSSTSVEMKQDDDATASRTQASSNQVNESSGPSSPEFGISSTSTLANPDDVSSIPNTSSESTWDNKSQTSNAVEKSSEQGEGKSKKQKRKDTDKEKAPAKVLQEAPPPAVNFWKQRAEEAKARAALHTSPPKPSPSASVDVSQTTVGKKATEEAKSETRKRSKFGSGTVEGIEGSSNMGRGGKQSMDATNRTQNGESNNRNRRDSRGDHQGDVARRSVPAVPEKENNPPLPPVGDQRSWPTPDSAQDGEKRKAQEKGGQHDKERTSGSSNRSHGKNEWVHVPYTPSVVFSTRLPGSGARRGGRGGSRGGRDAGTRGGSHAANGSIVSDKDAAVLTALPNGDLPRRGRSEGNAGRDASPPKGKRGSSADRDALRGSLVPNASRERATKDPAAGGADAQTSKSGSHDEKGSTSHDSPIPGHDFPRQHPGSRPRQNRKYETSTVTERRRESEVLPRTSESNNAQEGRRPSIVTQTDENGDRTSLNEGVLPHAKSGAPERRNGPYVSYPGRERNEGRGRGGARGRNGIHGHQHPLRLPAPHYANGHIPSLQSSSTYPFPNSPTFYHQDQQNTYFGSQPQHSRSYRGTGSRAHSVSTDGMYGRFSNSYSAGPKAMTPLQTYMGSMYDYQSIQPMSAVPYGSYIDQYSLMGMVSMQLEYYFSVDNLCKDMFLRKHMDSQGFVFLSVIADFNRIKQLTTDMELIKYVCLQPRTIEYRLGSDGKDRLRRREGWEQWVLSTPERDPSVQNDGPTELRSPNLPHPQPLEHPHIRQSMSAIPSSPGALPNGSFSQFTGVALSTSPTSGAYEPPSNSSYKHGNSGSTSAASLNGVGPSSQNLHASPENVDPEADSFSDEQIETLSVIVRKPESDAQPTSLPPPPSRTFSNGSIDSRSIVDELAKFGKHQSGTKSNGYNAANEDVDRKSQDPHSRSRSNSPQKPSNEPVRLFWVKNQDHPVESLPTNATYESYTHLRFKALDQRQASGAGSCPYDMDVLYQFWSHFLIRNFNTRMYDEFRDLAHEDVSQGTSSVGMANLIKYYGEALSSQNMIRERIARHYVDLVKKEDLEQGRPAFKQLRSAWRNGALNLKNRKKISQFVDKDLRELLER